MKTYGTRIRIKQLFEEIHSTWIRAAARNKNDMTSWTRKRNMPLCDILVCALGKIGLSAVMEIRHYFQAVNSMERIVSKQDYLKQRKKLNPGVFKLLNQNYLRRFYGGGEAIEWHGYLLMAVDGSGAEIPNSEENRKVFGENITRYGKKVARANISVLHDVLNGVILDIGIDNCRSSEREEAKAHIKALKETVGERPTLIMFDRNYASLEFMDYLEEMGVKYLIRLREGGYGEEREGMKGNDEEVELACTKARLAYLKRKSPGRAAELKEKGSVQARIIKGVFANGEQVAFVTNLSEFRRGDIQRLYRKRWSIEKKYHTLKNKLKFESVTGKASIYVRQDFWAQLLVYNIVQDLKAEAEYGLKKKTKKKGLKYEMRINENIAIGLFKEKLIRLFMEEDGERKEQMFNRLIADLEDNIVPVRKLKSAPRKWNLVNKYKCNLKPSF